MPNPAAAFGINDLLAAFDEDEKFEPYAPKIQEGCTALSIQAQEVSQIVQTRRQRFLLVHNHQDPTTSI